MCRHVTIRDMLVFISIALLWLGCSVNLEITPDLKNPITIRFEGVHAVLTPDTEMTVTAKTVPPDTENEYSYQWYLNGVFLDGEDGSSITIKGSELLDGNYRLDLRIIVGDIISSESCFFVVEYP